MTGTIERAWQLAADSSSRCAYALAQRADGTACHPRDPNATRWCLLGALMAVEQDSRQIQAAMDLLNRVAAEGISALDGARQLRYLAPGPYPHSWRGNAQLGPRHREPS